MIEQQMSMTGASMFWKDALHDYNINQSLPLPFDRYRLSDEHRTGRGTSVSFNFDQDLSHHFLSYASSKNIKSEYLALTIYYAFLFKLTNGEKDLCIGINTDGRYRDEFKLVIGMFVNAIPLRCQLDPHWSFDQLIDSVCEMLTNTIKYSYFPLQRILSQHSNTSKPTFLDTSFEFQLTGNDDENIENKIMIGDCHLHAMPISINISDDEVMSKFDFMLSIEHDININQLSCTINASLDLFNIKTIDKISQEFHAMLNHFFLFSDVQIKKSIYELSLILPDERLLMQSINNTQVLFSPASCIHHEFFCQAIKYSQKLAVELDEQSLTYSELLQYTQVLSLSLLNNHHIIPGEIVCQCVERSLSMVRILVLKSFFTLTKYSSLLGDWYNGN
jgi:non-ribosomal peptide synthetase component F